MNWLKKLVSTNIGRNISHAVLAFLATIVPVLQYTSVNALVASLIAAVPAAVAVLFRTLFPNIPIP